MTRSVELTRAETRAEVEELIRNAYAEGWREAKRRTHEEPPVLEIDWTQPGGVQITELWCVCATCRVPNSAAPARSTGAPS